MIRESGRKAQGVRLLQVERRLRGRRGSDCPGRGRERQRGDADPVELSVEFRNAPAVGVVQELAHSSPNRARVGHLLQSHICRSLWSGNGESRRGEGFPIRRIVPITQRLQNRQDKLIIAVRCRLGGISSYKRSVPRKIKNAGAATVADEVREVRFGFAKRLGISDPLRLQPH